MHVVRFRRKGGLVDKLAFGLIIKVANERKPEQDA